MYSKAWDSPQHKSCSWLMCCAYCHQRPLAYTRDKWSPVLRKIKACFSPDHIPVRVSCLLCIAFSQDFNWSSSSYFTDFFIASELTKMALKISGYISLLIIWRIISQCIYKHLVNFILSFSLYKPFNSQPPTITFLDLFTFSSLPLPAPTVEGCFPQGLRAGL